MKRARSAILPAILLASLLTAPPALAAGAPSYDLPAGPLRDAVLVLGRRAGISIGVEDARLWQCRVGAIRSGPTLAVTFQRLLAGTSAQADEVVPGVWRIHAVRPARARAHPAPVAPPPATASPGEEIVVTASKRDLHLRDYAGSVSVLAGEGLTFGGAGGTDAVLSRLATVSSTYLGAGRNKLFIRGIADSSFTGPTQATVGQYLGDARLTYNAPDPDLRLYDVQSVEVLEGPQGTLYGAGSLGGIIRIVPNPAVLDSFGGSVMTGVSATWHGAPSGDLAGTINLPVAAGKAALRLVGYAATDGGYIDNPLLRENNINRTTIAGGRADLRVEAGAWQIDLGGVVQQTYGDDSQYADADAPPLQRDSPVAEPFDAFYAMGDLVVSRDIGALRFRSTTALVTQRLDERYDATPPGGAAQVFRQRNATDLVANETRLWQPLNGRFGWVIGASVTHNATRLDRALGAVDAPAPVTGVDNRATEFTLFGEETYRFTDWLSLTAGGRLSHSLLAGDAQNVMPAASFVEAVERAAIVADRIDTRFLPSAALLATPVDKLSLYARYQQGFRAGGLAIYDTFVRRFEGDRVATIEGGLRYGVAGRDRFDFALAVSHTDWDDIQADFIDPSGLPTTDNIGNGRIWSVAVSGGWRPVPELRLDASFAFNDGRVTKPSASYAILLAQVQAEPAATVGIDRIPNVARLTGRVGADWQHRLSDALSLHVGGWMRYVGRSRLGVGPVLGAEQGNYTDSALTARMGSPVAGVTLGVTNLADAVGNRFALGTPFVTGRSQITPLRPRTIRLGFDFSF